MANDKHMYCIHLHHPNCKGTYISSWMWDLYTNVWYAKLHWIRVWDHIRKSLLLRPSPFQLTQFFFALLGEKGGREGSENLSLNRISHGLLTLAFLTGSSSQKKGARTCGAWEQIDKKGSRLPWDHIQVSKIATQESTSLHWHYHSWQYYTFHYSWYRSQTLHLEGTFVIFHSLSQFVYRDLCIIIG